MSTTTKTTKVVNTDPLLSVTEAAELCSVSTAFIYRAAADGALTIIRLGRAIRIRRSALDTFLANAEGRA